MLLFLLILHKVHSGMALKTWSKCMWAQLTVCLIECLPSAIFKSLLWRNGEGREKESFPSNLGLHLHFWPAWEIHPPPKKEVSFLILMLLKGLDVLEGCPWSPSRSLEILNNIHKIWRLCLMSSNVFYTRAQNRCRRGCLIQKHLQKACVLHFLFIDLNSCRIFKLIENETLYGWPFCSLHSIFL